MRITLQIPPKEKIARLEAEAHSRPAIYRLKLLLLALLGDSFLTFVRVFPFAAPMVIATLFYNNTFFYWLMGIALVFLVWLVRPGYRERGEAVDRKELPALFATLDELRGKPDVGRRLRVRLDDEVNASAREIRGVFGLLGTMRIMTLGMPLMTILGKDELRAVMAHELGHFSRRHGRLGHWLYWAHMGWLAHADSIDADSSILDRAGAGFAELFVPPFSRRAMVWSRRCEYEADADAAQAVDGRHLISGLVRLSAFTEWHENELPRRKRAWQCREPSAPADYLARVAEAFEQDWPRLVETAKAREAAQVGDWRDTHPSTAQRAAALGLPIDVLPRGAASGPELLGAEWSGKADAFNARWRRSNAVEWAVAHKRYMLIEAPLLASSPAEALEWPLPRRLARARALRRHDPGRGLEELKALHAAAPTDRAVEFSLASAMLTEGDTGAIERMIALAKADASYRVPACGRLIRYFIKSHNPGEVERWDAQIKASSTELSGIIDKVYNGILAGKARPTTRPDTVIDCLRAGLAEEKAVAKAWLLEGKTSFPAARNERELPLHIEVMILIIEPFDEHGKLNIDDVIRARHQDELGELIEPNSIPLVLSFMTTEPLPPALMEALDKHPGGPTYSRDLK